MIKFAKYHGCGNNFIITSEDDVISHMHDMPNLARKICNRYTGIGGDGLIVIGRSPLKMSLWNADGSEASMCGNGMRCLAAYCYDDELVPASRMTYDVETLAGKIDIEITQTVPFECKIGLAPAEFSPSSVGIDVDATRPSRIGVGADATRPSLRAKRSNPADGDFVEQEVSLPDGSIVTLSAVYTGTDHAVIFVDEAPWTAGPLSFVASEFVMRVGPQLQNIPLFERSVNVNFAHILAEDSVEMITYERGAGLTAACGTGACAVAAVGARLGRLSKEVVMKLPYGELKVEITDEKIYLSGLAARVGVGKYYG
jgi:diaminopimelate epimerase